MSGSSLGSSAQIPADTTVQGNLQVNGQGSSKIQGGLAVGLPGGVTDVLTVNGNLSVSGTSLQVGAANFTTLNAVTANIGILPPIGGALNVSGLVKSDGYDIRNTNGTLKIPTEPTGNSPFSAVVLSGTNAGLVPPVLTACSGFIRMNYTLDSTSTAVLTGNAWAGLADITGILAGPQFGTGSQIPKFFLTACGPNGMVIVNFPGQCGYVSASLIDYVVAGVTKKCMFVRIDGMNIADAPSGTNLTNLYLTLQYMIVA